MTREDPRWQALVASDVRWLHRLGRALATGEGEDATQDAWLTWLTHNPRGERRAWLRVVTLNSWRKRLRGTRRRREHEQAFLVAGETMVPSPDELALREEARRIVSGLVLALDEPYRSTVLLCYFEGLAPTEIARRQGLPPGTVRWRLKVARDRLRAELDGAHERKRGSGSWRALLMPLGPTKSAFSAGLALLLPKAATKVVAVVGLILLTALLSLLVPSLSPVPGNEGEGAREVPEDRGGDDLRRGSRARAAHPFMGVHRPGARTPVPPFVVRSDRREEAASMHAARLETTGTGDIKNKTGRTLPNWEEMKRRIRENLAALEVRAGRCLEDWPETDPSLAAGAMLTIEADASGLQHVWIKDRAEVPEGQLACISTSVHELDWRGITDVPGELTVPLRVARPDAGPR